MCFKFLCFQKTYRVQDFQIVRGPGWAGSERFDVEGKAEDP
jgi:uncharacterized protein (TIGR03435 family)